MVMTTSARFAAAPVSYDKLVYEHVDESRCGLDQDADPERERQDAHGGLDPRQPEDRPK